MKDIQGIERGKCNSPGCECEEYRTSSTENTPDSERRGGGKILCEYCDHTPVQHVKIIELGECKACGKDNCSKYEFDDPHSYSNCAYCDCPASQHAGAEKLRKPQPTPAFSSMPSGQPVSMFPAGQAAALPGGLFQVGMNSYGQPMYVGKCKVPNCPYPQRVEGDKVHDFCSRTCAKKYSQLSMQGGGTHVQTVVLSPNMSGPVPGHPMSMSQPPPPRQPTVGSTMMTTSLMTSIPSGTGCASSSRSGSQPTPGPATQQFTIKPVSVCKKCQKNPANPGHSWCHSCFQQH